MSNLYLYFGFAVVATVLNLICQNILIFLEYEVYLQILGGTLIGLVSKYYLDRQYVFKDTKTNIAGSFIMYSLFGALLTPLWWVIEIIFINLFGTILAQNIGAILGLAICYYLKYLLDKKYVFNSEG
ncbi:MAG: GtrA family protein [Gammaproteobacteria bacterium]